MGVPRMDQEPAGAEGSLATLRRVVAWVFEPGTAAGSNQRLGLLIEALREDPAAAEALGERIRCVLEGGRAARLFASTGLPSKPGLLAEFGKRLSDHFLPSPPLHGELARILTRIFPGSSSATRLAALRPELVEGLLTCLDAPLEPLRRGIPESLVLLGHRTAAHALTDDFLERSREIDVTGSPFVVLPGACEALGQAEGRARHDALHALLDVAAACRDVAAQVQGHLEAAGVSFDLVFRLQAIELRLQRIEKLARLHVYGGGEVGVGHGLALAASLVEGAWQERSLRSLVRRNVQLLSRKIVEHTGETGDHYITSSRSQYFKMLASAGGGGVLTAGTTIAKFWIAARKLPLLVEGTLASLNYAGSFVAMQLAGFTLATKQPSATAATLAMALGKRRQGAVLDAWVDVVARITRSQLAAALGNLGLVVPAVLLVESWLRSKGQGPLIDAATATGVLGSLHPLRSMTLPLAALTGVLLWLSSLAAGAVHNWSAYRRLPESVASTRWARLLGKRGSAWLEGFVGRHVAGIGGNVSLGLLLALIPLAGALTGLPLDVRHVTLSTASLTFATSSLGWAAVFSLEFVAAVAGIGLIACLNFGVSFALALWVALRAEGFDASDRGELLRALLGRLRSSPLDFVWPPRARAPAPAPAVEGPEPG